MPHIEIIDYDQSTGDLREIYNHIIATRGKLADVHTIQSLNPSTILSHMNLYKDIMFGQSPLKRYHREMLAVVVSVANQCDYCMMHHKEALLHYWKSNERIDRLMQNVESADLSPKEQLLCTFARDLTISPEASKEESIAILRQAGWDDRSILDATLVIAYFNFVNRIVLSLGLDINEAEIKGYTY